MVRTKLLKTYFYFSMSLVIAVVVVYGFSHTVNQGLIHAAIARPLILYVHAAVFSGWVIFFILQSALVRMKNVRLHRQLGWFGAGLGAAIPVFGVLTSITMARFNAAHFHAMHTDSDLIVQFFDMTAFSVFFTLAMLMRKKIEFHRRLVLIASCGLTAAAFGRFPHEIIPSNFYYAGVDALILLGVLRDLVVDRRVHQVYRFALPALIASHIAIINLSMIIK